MIIPRHLVQIADHALQEMEDLSGNTWFAEDGDAILRVHRTRAGVITITMAERSTVAGQDILIDAQRLLDEQRKAGVTA